jgi:hypothetical protein
MNDKREIEQLIKKFKEQYEEIYVTSFGDEDYVWRALGRHDYREIQRLAENEQDAYERICNAAVLYPKVDFSSYQMKAYIPDQLAPQILEMSGFGAWKKEVELLDVFRKQMESFDFQAEVIVATAFPNITFEEMGNWTKEKLMLYVARAEWQLRTLRGIDLRLGRASELEAEEMDENSVPVNVEAEADPQQQIMELANELRRQGHDPMFAMRWAYAKDKPPYVERPLIGSVNQIDTMIAGTRAWKEGVSQYGRYNIIREQVQKISRR